MKKKVLAIFLACFAVLGTLALGACGGGNDGDNNDVGETGNVELTEDAWQTEISKFKGFEGLKSYTIDVTLDMEIGENTNSLSSTGYIDREHGKLYVPDNKQLLYENSVSTVYFEMGNSFEIEEQKYSHDGNEILYIPHTVCNCKELFYDKNGLTAVKINCLDYSDAEKMFTMCAGLTMLENIKYNGEIIGLEDAYDKFNYNEETKSYSASVELLAGYSIPDYFYSFGPEVFASEEYKHIEMEEHYVPYYIEISFQQNSFTMTMKTESENQKLIYNLKIYDFNKTQINLSAEDAAALAE